MPKPFEEWPEALTPEDLKECLGMGHVDAYKMFQQPDFPLIMKVKRNKKVGKFALRAYINKGVPIHDRDNQATC